VLLSLRELGKVNAMSYSLQVVLKILIFLTIYPGVL
jgi:hypothetical protein